MNKLAKQLILGLLMATIALGPASLSAGQSINKKTDQPHELILEIAKDPSLGLYYENLDKLIKSQTAQQDEPEERKSVEAFEKLIHNFLEKNKEPVQPTLKNHDYAIALNRMRSIQPQALINVLNCTAKANNFALFKRLFHTYYNTFKSEDFNPTPTQLKKGFEGANNKKALQWIDCFKKYQNKETFDESEYGSYCDLVCFFNDIDAFYELIKNDYDLTYCIPPAIFYQNHKKYPLSILQRKLLKQLYGNDYPKSTFRKLLASYQSYSKYEKQIIDDQEAIITIPIKLSYRLPIDLLLRNYQKQLKNIGIVVALTQKHLPQEIKHHIAEY